MGDFQNAKSCVYFSSRGDQALSPPAKGTRGTEPEQIVSRHNINDQSSRTISSRYHNLKHCHYSTKYSKGYVCAFAIKLSNFPRISFCGGNTMAYRFNVLVVDDQHVCRIVFSKIIESIGYLVTAVSTGEECLDLSSRTNFDIVFIDYLMPGLNGVETARCLSELTKADHTTPRIFLTSALADNELSDLCTRNDALDGYLSKPILKDAVISIFSTFNHNPKGEIHALHHIRTEEAPHICNQSI